MSEEEGGTGLTFVPLQPKPKGHNFDTKQLNAIQKKKKMFHTRHKSANLIARDEEESSFEENSLRVKSTRKKSSRQRRHRRVNSERLGKIDMRSREWNKLTKKEKLMTLEREKREIEEKINLLEYRRQKRLTISLRQSAINNAPTPRMRKRGGPIKPNIFQSMVEKHQPKYEENDDHNEKFLIPKKIQKGDVELSTKIRTSILDSERDDGISNIFKSQDSREKNVFRDFEAVEREKIRKLMKKQKKSNKKNSREPAMLINGVEEKLEESVSIMESELRASKLKKKRKKKSTKRREAEAIKNEEENENAIVHNIELSDDEDNIKKMNKSPKKRKRKKKKKRERPPDIVIVAEDDDIDDIVKNDPRSSEMGGKKSKRKRNIKDENGSFYDPENLRKYGNLMKKSKADFIDIQGGDGESVFKKKKKKKKKKNVGKGREGPPNVKNDESIDNFNFFVDDKNYGGAENNDDSWGD